MTVRTAWLIRHAESASNAGMSTAAPADIPLTDRGHRQAARLAAAIPAAPSLIVTSPYLRARQTAEPAFALFPEAAHEEWPVQEFTYLGDLHGRATTPEERRPIAEAYWRRADPHESLGGAECFADLLARARECLTLLAARDETPIAVFTHGIFTRAVLWSLLTGVEVADHAGMRAFRHFYDHLTIPNTAVVALRFPAGGTPHLATGVTW